MAPLTNPNLSRSIQDNDAALAMRLGPDVVAFAGAYLLQGMILTQSTRYLSAWWSTDKLYTRVTVALIIGLSLLHTGFLSAMLWQTVVSHFGDRGFLEHYSWLNRLITASSTLLAFPAQIFFVRRVYYLQWRYDYLFMPLVFFCFGTFATMIGRTALMPSQLSDGNLPSIFIKIRVASSIFPLLLASGHSAILTIFLHRRTASSDHLAFARSILSLTMHSGVPAAILSALVLAASFERPPGDFYTLFNSLIGYAWTLCVLHALTDRTHPRSTPRSTPSTSDSSAATLAKDLRWTCRVPLIPASALVDLTPVRRNTLPDLPLSAPAQAQETFPSRRREELSRRISEGDSGKSIVFMPPGLVLDHDGCGYDASQWKPVQLRASEESGSS